MASTYSTNLKIELQATGENSGTWGTITNTNLGTALEQAIVGYGNPNYASDANLTLTYTDTNAAQAARALVLNVTSGVSLTGTRELVVPTIQKQYIVQNNTTGSQSITVKTSAGTGITVPNGRKAHLYVNGTDVIYMDDYVDINGGAIDGTPIGANSASTGAFSTLSASGNVTLSGGTANGVLYLNASKVATSGSALTFDGDALTLGGTAPRLRANMSGTQSTRFAIQNSTTDGNTRFFFYPNGTGSVSAIQGWNTSNLSATDYQLFDFGIISTIDIRLTSGVAGAASYLPITFYNGGGEKMRLDSSGRLGLNTTPGTGSGLFSLAYTSASLYSTAGAHPGAADTAFCGTYAINPSATTGAFAGNVLYVRNGSSVYQSAGMSAVSVAGSGYSPNLNFWAQDGASTFATRMTLDSSGNLGIGTASPNISGYGANSRVLTIQGVSGSYAINELASNSANSDGTYVGRLDFSSRGQAAGYENIASIASFLSGSTSTKFGSVLQFFTRADNAGSGSPVERMRIDSSGNVGIGGTAGGNVKTQLLGSFPVLGGNTNSNGIAVAMEVPSAITSSAYVFRSLPSIAASTATTSVYQYAAAGVTLGSGATLTNNVGFFADGLTSATNNFGFYSNIASGTGRWNFYANGTADNYFAGNVGIGVTPTVQLDVKNGAGNCTISAQYGTGTKGQLIAANNEVQLKAFNGTNDVLTFATGVSERMRITAGGNLLVGTTTDVSGRSGVISDISGNVRAIPRTGAAKTGSYTLAVGDVGQFVEVGSGGSVTVPNSTFAMGDVVSIFNNTSGNVTLTMSITTAYIGGTDADKNTITLATRGVATILFISGTVCVVNGNVS